MAEKDDREPLLQADHKAAWLMCLQASVISMPDDWEAEDAAQFADDLLDEFLSRYDPNWKPVKKRKKK